MLRNTTGKTILIADDDDIFANITGKLLQSRGFVVTVCSCGREALAKLATTKFDAVLLDNHMPDYTGHDVVTILINTSNSNARNVIMLSGSDDAHLSELKNEYAIAAMGKPFMLDALIEKINHVCSGANR